MLLLKKKRAFDVFPYFKKHAQRLAGLPFLTVVVAILFGGSSFANELYDSVLVSLGLAIYFVYLKFDVDEKLIISVATVFVIVTFIVHLWQLTHMGNILFGLNALGFTGYKRNAIFRLKIGSPFVAFLVLFYNWQYLLEKVTLKRVLVSVVCFVSIYLSLTRQYYVATAVAILYSLTLLKHNKKVVFLGTMLTIVVFSVAFFFYDALFADFVYITKTDTFSTDVRELAYPFFLKRSFDNVILAILGHGHPSVLTTWGMKYDYWNTDVGFIGELFCFGLVYVCSFFYCVYAVLVKHRKKLPLFIQLYVVASLTCCLMVFPIHSCTMAVIWGSVLYLADVHLNRGSYGNEFLSKTP